MKKLFAVALPALALTAVLAAQANAESAKTAPKGQPAAGKSIATAKYELVVDGMHCESCVDNLTTQLESMTEMVETGTVKVDLKSNKASLTLKNTGKDAAALKSLQEKLNKTLASNGFTVTSVKVLN